jgi:hypothetical protein
MQYYRNLFAVLVFPASGKVSKITLQTAEILLNHREHRRGFCSRLSALFH